MFPASSAGLYTNASGLKQALHPMGGMLAFLGGLPAANNWDKTLRKVSQAILALYAVAVCFGIASTLTGIILQFVEKYAG